MIKSIDNIKAIFFDIDGTLFFSNGDEKVMPDSTLKALYLLREKGLKLFIATGRHKNNLTLLDGVFDFDGFITINGQYCFVGDYVTRRCAIDKQDIITITEHAQKGLYAFYYISEEEIFVSSSNKITMDFCEKIEYQNPKVLTLDEILEYNIYQLNALLTKENEHLILDGTENVRLARWDYEFVDVIPKNGDKSAGVKSILDYTGIKKEEIIAFGDGENDMEMLQYAGLGIAMGNSYDITKEHADYITDNVEEDGIYNALKKFEII